ncbi:alpha/beta fold hydrolase [Pseudoduganella buxea]|uniref:Alpha/beta fold hydrolase n=1 Tax=Pseudoduganella buxea TaxID=1949069 RepID=A0A6I3T816_9BURK|nr:alpha/beta fold hydrolase [Pseudoduganella buxea]MTV55737.1 alpha/beta fold hydrolase [Pseudoduganella buxea]GGC13411.1 lipase [Pseudoduganella buxea]
MTFRATLQGLADRLLDAAMTAERKQARLESGTIALPSGPVAYFHRPGSAAPCGDAVVMLHGAASDKSAWVRLAARLRSPWPLLIPDLPGHGDSPASPDMRFDIAAQAGRLLAFLDALGIRRAHLVGNSMGGAIALRVAAAHPAQVGSLILIASAGAEARPGWLKTRYGGGGGNPMVDVDDAAAYRAMLRIGMEAPPHIPRFLVGALARRYRARRELNARIEREIYGDLDQTPVLDRVLADTLVIWGAEDRVLHVDDAELLRARIRHSSKVVLPGVGHVPMVEAPAQVAPLCQQFLDRQATAAH